MTENINIVFAGHVDHGKSTLIGRLLLDTNSLQPHRIEEAKKSCESLGKEWEPAFILDQFREEREKGITIDTTQMVFKTENKLFVIIDAPGHVEFTQNMVTGASQADAAVIIVDSDEGLMEQSRRHAYIIGMLGIKQVIVACNKMDLIDYDEMKFNEIVKSYTEFLDTIDISPKYFVPLSAKNGINITKKSDEMQWYSGPTFLDSLDILVPHESKENLPFCFPVQDVYNIENESVYVGRIEFGKISIGDEVTVLPSGSKVKISDILVYNESPTGISVPANIGIKLENKNSIVRGDVICHHSADLKLKSEFKVLVFWMGAEPLKNGGSFEWRLATQRRKAIVKDILTRVNSSTLENFKDTGELQKYEVGELLIELETPAIINDFNKFDVFGRFVLERNYNVCGGGLIFED